MPTSNENSKHEHANVIIQTPKQKGKAQRRERKAGYQSNQARQLIRQASNQKNQKQCKVSKHVKGNEK